MNIHIVYVLHTYFTTTLSFLTNSYLIFLILKRTPSGMKRYSNVLLQTCIVDLLISLVTFSTMLECETLNGRFFFRISAPWFPAYGYFPCFGLWLFLINLTTVYCITFIQPLFRYFLIVRKSTLTTTKTWMLHFLTFFTAALLSAEYSSSYCRNEEDLTFNSILSNINPWKFEESFNSFRSRDLMNMNVIIYIASLTIVASACNGVFVFCTFKVVKNLKNYSSIYSKQTLKMHKELNRKSLYQMIHPMVSLLVLLITCAVIYFKENSGTLLISLMFIQYITILNPIITILTIQSYRNALIKKKTSSLVSKTGQSVVPFPLP